MEERGADEAARAVVERLQGAGFEAYYAGGCVRDRLRGAEPHDFDVATGALPEAVQELFPGSNLTGVSFGVVRVRIEGHEVEVATFRVDGPYRDGRRPEGVRFATAQEDAQRRDFTVNALFFDPVADVIHDFVGGRADLEAKTLRAVGEPRRRFEEDRLRLLRAVRFAANLGFEIELETWEAVRAMASGIRSVSAERVRDELTKLWCGPDPRRGLELLDASGLLVEVLPEVSAMKGVEQPPQFHPEGDVFVHTGLMLSMLKKPSEILAWSVLLHDVGKPRTQTVDETGRIRFNGHEHVGEVMAREILMRLRFSNHVTEAVCACVSNHMAFKDVPKMRASTLKRFMARPTFEEELELHRVDCLGSHGYLDVHAFLAERRQMLSEEQIKPKPLLTGEDVKAQGLKPGPAIGALLREAYDRQLDGELEDREAALAWLTKRLGAGDG